MPCPDETKISDFVSRTLPIATAAQIEEHLASCNDCRDLVFALASSSAVHGPDDPATERVGRFELLDVLGRGAMGVVYRARDPELDREVAVKVRRSHARLDVDAEDRLRREAQALARLTHPNVVAVHETGRHGAMFYVAMEYVEGVTLDAWLASAQPQSAIVDLMIGAGRGLAAAHAVGLIHRDFKPRNVFVSTAEIAKVGDFGLVRLTNSNAAITLDKAADLGVTLSAAGSIVGTPAYMAPEQLHGSPATEASDQFSFCVTLFEALYNRRPFTGATIDQLVAAMQKPLALPATPRVPRHIRHVLARGLEIEPSRRFSSMPALLERLATRTSVVRWVAVAMLATAGIAGAAMLSSSSPSATCTGSEHELDGVWDPTRRIAMRAAFRATGLDHADEVATRTQAILDRHGAAWIAARESACEATHDRRAQTEAVLELRTACLDERRSELRALTDLLVRADKATVDNAIAAAAALDDIEQCADVPALQQVVRPPADPVLRAQVAARREELATVKALLGMARADQGLARARTLADATRALDYAPLHADALVVLGTAIHDMGNDDEAIRVLRAAAAAADAGADDRARFDAWDYLIQVLVFARRIDSLDDALQQARAVLSRAPYDAALQQRMLLLEGYALVAKGQPKQAVVRYRELIAAQEHTLAPDHPNLAASWTALADALARAGDTDEVVAAAKRAEDIVAKAYGTGHMAQVEAQSQASQAQLFQGMMLLDQKKPTEALALIEPAVAKLTQIHGAEHEAVGMATHLLGMAYHALGRFPEARTQHRRALAINRAILGEDNIKTAASLTELALLDFDERSYERAAEGFAAARDVFAKVRGPASMQAAGHDLWTARAWIGARRLDDAARHVARVRALGEPFGNAPSTVALEAEILVERGRTAEGIAMFERAFKLPPGRGEWIGRAELVLARALDKTGRRRDARAHAERAVAAFDGRGEKRDAAEARTILESLR